MTLRDDIKIDTGPDAVWPFLENPEKMQIWNPKIKSFSPSFSQTPALGYRYRIAYELRGTVTEMDAEIVRYERPHRLTIRMTGGSLGPRGVCTESYRLTPERDGVTIVEQVIRIRDPRVPLLFRLLIPLVHRFGKSDGPRYLETLKTLAERVPEQG